MIRKRKIAIVEDLADHLELLQVMLQDHFDLMSYISGQDFLEGVKKQIPDLVLMDIALADIHGLDLIKQVRLDPNLSEVPVIAVTAHAFAEERKAYLQAGFSEHLTKPVDQAALLYTIRSHLSGTNAFSDLKG